MSHADEIKHAVSCMEFMKHYGLHVNRSGFARCMFHDDHNASMKVYEGQRGFFCYTCHKGGTVVDLAMQYHCCDFKTALHVLNDDFMLGIALDDRATPQQIKEKQKQAELRQLRLWLDEQCKRTREDAYWMAFDRWFENEKVIMDNRPDPKTPGAEWNELFRIAIDKRYELYEELMIAEERRRKSYVRD